MPSEALRTHLAELLTDATELVACNADLRVGGAGRRFGLASLDRAVVLACVSAWEAYIEELVRQSLAAMRPEQPPRGLWTALNATIRGQIGRFNNPNT